MGKGLTAYQLKVIAVIAMVIDHLASIAALPQIYSGSMSRLITAMNAVGRMTIPIMCFFVAEGYYHTSNLKKYLLRMFIFAAVSQIPFFLFECGCSFSEIPGHVREITHMNVIFTLFMGLLALTVWNSERFHIILKIPLTAAIVFLTKNSDWRIFAVLWILAFGIFRGDFKKQAAAFVIISAIRVFVYYVLPGLNPVMPIIYSVKTMILQSCTVFALIPLYFYNGRPGRKSKYGFYIFYPAHLLALAAIKFIIMG